MHQIYPTDMCSPQNLESRINTEINVFLSALQKYLNQKRKTSNQQAKHSNMFLFFHFFIFKILSFACSTIIAV